MENVPICYQNGKVLYFSHYQFLLLVAWERKRTKKKKLFGLCFLTLIILYYKTRDPKIY